MSVGIISPNKNEEKLSVIEGFLAKKARERI
jgi:hypothetical protein